MNDYDFTLKFTFHNANINFDQMVERLGEDGCDDALVGIGQNGRIALNFTRNANSAYDAISSALTDVKRAIPDAKLVEATPDFVGLTDVADILGFTRQNMRKIMINHGSTFPAPLHEGNSTVWHLAKVLLWLREMGTYQIEDRLIDVAKTNMQFNILKEMSDLEPTLHHNMRELVL